MTLLLLVAALLIACGLLFRELQLARERRANTEAHQRLAVALTETRGQLRRTQEDFYVLRRLLEEKHLVDDADVASARVRLVDTPRQSEAERDEIVKSLNVSPTHLVIDEGRDKIH